MSAMVIGLQDKSYAGKIRQKKALHVTSQILKKAFWLQELLK